MVRAYRPDGTDGVEALDALDHTDGTDESHACDDAHPRRTLARMVPAAALPELADLTHRTSAIVRQLHGCLDPLGRARGTVPIAHELAAVERELAWLVTKLQCALLDTAHQTRTRAS